MWCLEHNRCSINIIAVIFYLFNLDISLVTCNRDKNNSGLNKMRVYFSLMVTFEQMWWLHSIFRGPGPIGLAALLWATLPWPTYGAYPNHSS